MGDPMRIRARVKGDVVEAHVLMPHPMETGFRHDDGGTLIEAHYITEIRIEAGGRPVMTARMGIGVSADPILTFRFRGAAKGDRIDVAWTDNRGDARTDSAIVG